MYKVNRANDAIFFTGSNVKVLISGKDTGGQFCMMDFRSPPGRSTPLHVHEREEETIHMLAGEMEVTVGDKSVLLHAGDTILLPRHVAHRLSIQGNSNSHYIVVCTPAGFDEFVEACASEDNGADTAPSPSPTDIARLRDQAPRFGITLLQAKPL